ASPRSRPSSQHCAGYAGARSDDPDRRAALPSNDHLARRAWPDEALRRLHDAFLGGGRRPPSEPPPRIAPAKPALAPTIPTDARRRPAMTVLLDARGLTKRYGDFTTLPCVGGSATSRDLAPSFTAD